MVEPRTTAASPPRRGPVVCLVVFLLFAAAWAFRPVDRKDWLLENALTAAFVAYLVWSRRRFPLSNLSYVLILVFLCLHTIGAHYTYSLVPYRRWIGAIFGESAAAWLGGRNQFDRFVHFSFGLLLAYPIREIFVRVAAVRGFWGYYLPLDIVMSFSMIYELIEWAAAVVLGGDLGQTFLGTQGDEWDAHKDMALATLGGLICVAVTAFINWKYDRDFAKDFWASLVVKRSDPLGEVRLRELRSERSKPDDLGY